MDLTQETQNSITPSRLDIIFFQIPKPNKIHWVELLEKKLFFFRNHVASW